MTTDEYVKLGIIIASALVVSLVAILILFGLGLGYLSRRNKRKRGNRPMTGMSIINDEQLPLETRAALYRNLIDQCEKSQDYEFAAMLRDKLQNLKQ
jgi:hypothetical protein